MEARLGPLDFFQDIVGFGSPDERFGSLVVLGEVVLDGLLEFGQAVKDAAANALRGEVAEEALDHVEPRGAGRGEVDMKAGMARQPVTDSRVLMGRVVVSDQVQRAALGGL